METQAFPFLYKMMPHAYNVANLLKPHFLRKLHIDKPIHVNYRFTDNDNLIMLLDRQVNITMTNISTQYGTIYLSLFLFQTCDYK